ncbi:MAG: Na/Pi cotransporter family protein, partial [Flavobacteriaceae bacterium]|nr:Na/Pi cotransporter family protein [Flavobacteriaceae bacterium]
TLKLALFHTIFNIIGVLIMIPFIKILERFLIRFIKEKVDKDIDEPKFLSESVLLMPTSAISALVKESKYLYKNAIFEIVSHSLNIHREDVKSDEKVKNIIKKSTKDLNIDIDDIYYKKVKHIYSEIITYITTTQNSLKLNKRQDKIVSNIKVANRKMVEIIKDTRELNKNITLSQNLNNPYLEKEYDGFRKKITKVLRIIYLFRTEEETEKYAEKLSQLKKEAKENIKNSNDSIDKLIRKDLINPEMASSLFNDNYNVNEIIKKLIVVAELLYGKIDTLLDENNTAK